MQNHKTNANEYLMTLKYLFCYFLSLILHIFLKLVILSFSSSIAYELFIHDYFCVFFIEIYFSNHDNSLFTNNDFYIYKKHVLVKKKNA
jgi:hypothetical protein